MKYIYKTEIADEIISFSKKWIRKNAKHIKIIKLQLSVLSYNMSKYITMV